MHLLEAEFPEIKVIELPSYHIEYSSSNMILNIGKQLPRILFAIKAEQWMTERLVKEHGITHIISDNRYGCFSAKTTNTLITHQLHLRIPSRPLEWLANRILKQAFKRFDEIWTPDTAHDTNLSGELAHPPIDAPPVKYIGLLSRMEPGETDHDYDVAVVLSGPEPQRTILEQRIIEQAVTLPYKFIVIQGRPNRKHHHYAAENVEVVSYLTSSDLNEVLLCSETIVCRAGYSSIMDLAVLGKKAVLIPTPGQTEQEYLSQELARNGFFVVQDQDKLNLETALEEVENTAGIPAGMYPQGELKVFLREWGLGKGSGE